MQKNRKAQIVRCVLGDAEFTKGDELVYHCPKCSHRKPKLSINVVTDRFHCWICDWHGSNLVPIIRMSSDRSLLAEYLDERDDLLPKQSDEKRYRVPVLPREFRSLSTPSSSPYRSAALAYLERRGITAEDVLRWRLGYCEDGPYEYRVVIPSFDDLGELNFFSGRAYLKRAGLSYKHEEGYCKDIVWNDLLIDWRRPIVLTEGPFDAMKARHNTIALQGSIFNTRSRLFRKIVMTGVPVYFAMDSDAFGKQLDIIERCIGFGIESYYVDLGDKKDVGEMTHDEFERARAGATSVRSSLDIMRVRLS